MFLNMKLKLANQRAQEGPHLNGERLTRMVVRCGARGGSLGLPTVFVAVPTPVDCRLHRKETAKKMLCKKKVTGVLFQFGSPSASTVPKTVRRTLLFFGPRNSYLVSH